MAETLLFVMAFVGGFVGAWFGVNGPTWRLERKEDTLPAHLIPTPYVNPEIPHKLRVVRRSDEIVAKEQQDK